MATDTHTPGPWRASDRHVPGMKLSDVRIIGPQGQELAELFTNDGMDEPEWYPVEANARLIAAAPEMLEALRYLVDVIAVDALLPESVSYMRLARAVIAKAEGR